MPPTVLRSSIPAILAELTPALSKVVETSAQSILERARNAMQASDSEGEDSDPGEAPAIDSGALYNSGAVEVDGLTAEAGFGTDHAVILEFAMNRPFLTPAAEEERKEFEKAAAAAVGAVVSKNRVG